jgi:hypothetical protein
MESLLYIFTLLFYMGPFAGYHCPDACRSVQRGGMYPYFDAQTPYIRGLKEGEKSSLLHGFFMNHDERVGRVW